MSTGPLPHALAQVVLNEQDTPVPVALAAEAGERRFIELDALRGLAACAVIFLHYSSVPMELPTWLADLIAYTPFFLLVCGTQAVVFFFVLSGFVLSLPYIRGSSEPYLAFIIKRVFRIYIPYLVAIGFAVW